MEFPWLPRRGQIRERGSARLIHFAPIGRDGGVARPFLAPVHEIRGILDLTTSHDRDRCPGEFSPVVRARGLDGSVCRRAMKEQDDARHMMELDEIQALLSDLHGANVVAPSGRECPATSGKVQTVVPHDPEGIGEKLVGGFLQPAVGARDDERVGTCWCPVKGTQ